MYTFHDFYRIISVFPWHRSFSTPPTRRNFFPALSHTRTTAGIAFHMVPLDWTRIQPQKHAAFLSFFPPRVPISRRSVLYSDSAVYINNKPRSTRKKKKYTPGFCGRSVGLLSTGAATFYQIGLRFPSVDSILLCCEWERFFLSLPPPLKCVTKLTRGDALPVAI